MSRRARWLLLLLLLACSQVVWQPHQATCHFSGAGCHDFW
jgi:hypothetical protein